MSPVTNNKLKYIPIKWSLIELYALETSNKQAVEVIKVVASLPRMPMIQGGVLLMFKEPNSRMGLSKSK